MTDPNRSPAARGPRRSIAVRAALLGVLAAACATTPAADLVLTGGRIATVDPALGEVSALAARDGRIVAVGSDAEVATYVGATTRVIDLEGRRALPGFIEGHGHFTGIGAMAEVLDLRGVTSFDAIVALVAEAARTAEPGAWILGRGWHQEKWDAVPADAVEGFPTHAALSAVSPANPVALKHASGHASLFNDRALELAGISPETTDPPGGELVRDARGFPTGVLVETAQELVERVHRAELATRTSDEVRADIERTLRLADAECLSKGVTSFQDAGSSFETVEVMRGMAERGELGTRLWVMLREDNALLAERLPGLDLVDVGDGHLTVRAIKRTLDGRLAPPCRSRTV
jgi:predicted amidohydrolase YtcJ